MEFLVGIAVGFLVGKYYVERYKKPNVTVNNNESDKGDNQ